MFKVNDIAFAYDVSCGVCKVMILGINEKVAWVRFEHSVDKFGNPMTNHKFGGSANRFLFPEREYRMYGIWHSAEEAYAAWDAVSKEKEEEFRRNINNVEDLLRFPLANCLCGNSDVDYTAVEIYKEKAKEILDIDL